MPASAPVLQVVESAVSAVQHLRSLGCTDIEFSPEDASRSDIDFLYRILGEVIKAGATTINIPDTTGQLAWVLCLVSTLVECALEKIPFRMRHWLVGSTCSRAIMHLLRLHSNGHTMLSRQSRAQPSSPALCCVA